MDNELGERALKLLADPHKLKDQIIFLRVDRLQVELENKFNCDISSTLYQHLVETIQVEIEVSSVIDNIITSISNEG